MPRAPAAKEVSDQTRMSSGSATRPSSLSRSEHLRLHPERAALALGVPERLAARGGAGDVAAVEVAPGLAALARLDPGVAEDLDLGGGEPVVAAFRRHVGDGAGDAVGGDQVLRIDGADGVDAPLHLAVEVVALEGEPVEAFRVGADLDRGLDVLPFGVAVAVPGLGERRRGCRTSPSASRGRRPWCRGCSRRRASSWSRSRRRSRTCRGGRGSGWRARSGRRRRLP